MQMKVIVIDRCGYCDGEAYLYVGELINKHKENEKVVLR
jgi:hypothetical protein